MKASEISPCVARARSHGAGLIIRLLVCALLVALIATAGADAAFPGPNGRIAFSSGSPTAANHIVTMNPDGSGQIEFGGRPDTQPAWSPDGAKIAFLHVEESPFFPGSYFYRLLVMTAGGTRTTTQVADNGGQPAWSPDGSRIAFCTNPESSFSSEIYVMNADGTNKVRYTNNTVKDCEPAWSPDGAKIAFATKRDGASEIYTMNADGTNQANLTNRAFDDEAPTWSPDGTKIAFHTFRDGNYEIYTMNADGTNQVNRTNNPAHDQAATWSPDGALIAFHTGREGVQNSEIYTMNADGTNPVNRTNRPAATDREPDWQTMPPDTAKPSSSASSPAQSNSTSITVNYTASDGSGSGVKEVELWVQRPGDATYSLAATDITPASASFAYTAAAGDGSYRFYTRARDNAANYEDAPAGPPDSTTLVDTTAPAPPTFTDTDPPSPANDNNPKVKGTAEANSTVGLYTNASCSGSPTATGTASEFASPGIAVSVADNTTTTFYGSATDQANRVSACSLTSITYVEDSTVQGGRPPSFGGGGLPTGSAGIPETSGPLMALAGEVVKMDSGGAVRLPLSCPSSEPGGCRGTLSLETFGRVRVSNVDSSRKPRKRKVTLGKSPFQVAGGATATIRVRLSRKNQRLVKRLKRVRVLAIINARDQAGNAQTTKKTLILRAAERRRTR